MKMTEKKLEEALNRLRPGYRDVLLLSLGVKCDSNPEGRFYSPKEIAKKLKRTKVRVDMTIDSGMEILGTIVSDEELEYIKRRGQ